MEASSEKENLEVCLKDNSIMLGTSKLFNKEEMSDVILVVGDKTFYAHRFVLAKSSSVFQTMLYGKHWLESAGKEVTLKETPECEAVFDLFLEYLYTAEVSINVETTIAILSLADKYDVTSLKHVYLKAIMLNTKSLIQSTIWLDLDIDCLETMLSSSELVIHQESDLFWGLSQWLLDENHVASLKENSERLLPLIRFPQVLANELWKIQNSELANHKESSGILHELLGRAFSFRTLCPVSGWSNFSDTFYMPRDYLSRKVCEWKTQADQDRLLICSIDTRRYPAREVLISSDEKHSVQVDLGPGVSGDENVLWDIFLACSENSVLTLRLRLSAEGCLDVPIQVNILVTDVKNRVVQSKRTPIHICQEGSELKVNAVISHPEQVCYFIVLMKVVLAPSPTPPV